MVEEAKTVFKTMRRNKCFPDICSYATMLSAYVNTSDMEGAEKFFRRIKQDGLEPNVVIYGTLMKGYAKMNDLEKMMQTYEDMRVQGIEANQTILTTIMDAHGKNTDFGSAVIWFNEMTSRGFPPDQKAKNILLSLAKTPEEKGEADELTGNSVGDLSKQEVEESVKFAFRIDENSEITSLGSDLSSEGHKRESKTSKFADLDDDDEDYDEIDDYVNNVAGLGFVSLEDTAALGV